MWCLDKPKIFVHEEYELNKETEHLAVLKLICSVQVRVIIIRPPSPQWERPGWSKYRTGWWSDSPAGLPSGPDKVEQKWPGVANTPSQSDHRGGETHSRNQEAQKGNVFLFIGVRIEMIYFSRMPVSTHAKLATLKERYPRSSQLRKVKTCLRFLKSFLMKSPRWSKIFKRQVEPLTLVRLYFYWVQLSLWLRGTLLDWGLTVIQSKELACKPFILFIILQ